MHSLRRLLFFLYVIHHGDASHTLTLRFVYPYACHLACCVVDKVWLPMDYPSFLVARTAQGRAVLPLEWQVMVLRFDFSEGSRAHPSTRGSGLFEGAALLWQFLLEQTVG